MSDNTDLLRSLRAGLGEYAGKQRLVRIQPTLDSHGHGRVFRLSVSVCPESSAQSKLFRPSMQEAQALEAAYFKSGHAHTLRSIIHKAIMNCLLIYVVIAASAAQALEMRYSYGLHVNIDHTYRSRVPRFE